MLMLRCPLQHRADYLATVFLQLLHIALVLLPRLGKHLFGQSRAPAPCVPLLE